MLTQRSTEKEQNRGPQTPTSMQIQSAAQSIRHHLKYVQQSNNTLLNTHYKYGTTSSRPTKFYRSLRMVCFWNAERIQHLREGHKLRKFVRK